MLLTDREHTKTMATLRAIVIPCAKRRVEVKRVGTFAGLSELGVAIKQSKLRYPVFRNEI